MNTVLNMVTDPTTWKTLWEIHGGDIIVTALACIVAGVVASVFLKMLASLEERIVDLEEDVAALKESRRNG